MKTTDIDGASEHQGATSEKPIDRVLEVVEEITGRRALTSGDGYKACCPAHEDENPSLLIGETAGGGARLKCMAGCEKSVVLAALGLSEAEIDPNGMASGVEAVYRYATGDGALLAEKIRKPEKKFVWRRPDGDGDWIYTLKPGWYRRVEGQWERVAEPGDADPGDEARLYDAIKMPLYRAAEVKQAVALGRTICFVEGEKDADNVAKLGLASTTTWDGASGGWREWYSALLTGAKVVVIPDLDDAGKKYAKTICDNLVKVAQEVRRLELPDMPEGGKDISDWLEAGHDRGELERLIGATEPLPKAGGMQTAPTVEILDEMPPKITQPLTLSGGRAYCSTFAPVRKGDEDTVEIISVRDDGQMIARFSNHEVMSARDAGVTVRMDYQPPPEKLWSTPGLKRYAAGERVDPVKVYRQVVQVVDHFVDFDRGYASQQDMAELISLFVVSTYLLPGLNVTGYLWPTGEPGSGKSQLLHVVCEMSYLGQVVLAAGTFSSLRDLADYGATIGFDDAENVSDTRRFDPDKRALMLAGNRRGTTIPVKVEAGGNRWAIRNVNAFCPRLFSAVRLPDPVLASRTIMVPMVRSCDGQKTKRSPQDYSSWPCDRRRLVDDLFSMGLAMLPAVGRFDQAAADKSRLIGRDLEPWRSLLAVALMLEDWGLAGLYERMEKLAVQYQRERQDVEEASPARVAVICMVEMIKRSRAERLTIVPSELAEAMNTYAAENELVDQHASEFTNAKRAGFLLKRLRIMPDEIRVHNKRVRILTQKALAGLAAAYSVPCDFKIEPVAAQTAAAVEPTESPEGPEDPSVGPTMTAHAGDAAEGASDAAECAESAKSAKLQEGPKEETTDGAGASCDPDSAMSAEVAESAELRVPPRESVWDLMAAIAAQSESPEASGNKLNWDGAS